MSPLTTHSTDGFLALLRPEIEAAHDALCRQIAAVAAPPLPNAGALVAMLFGGVRPHLERLVTPTLALELNVARLRGQLDGDTPQERFGAYVQQLAQPGPRAALAAEYPALFQLAAGRLARWVDVSREWVMRLAADWPAIVQTFFNNQSPGLLVKLHFPQRSTKRGGQAVVLLAFASGARLVYKPRPLTVEMAYQALLRRLNTTGFEPGFRPLPLLDRPAYGWMAWIEPADCATEAEVSRFYRRQGAHLALFYALEATDLHMSNVIAAGEHPALIDLETLFHPRAAAPDWPPLDLALDDAIYYSVLRPGLLPEPETDDESDAEQLDLSGLTGAGGQRTLHAVPVWRDRDTDAMRLTHERQTIGGGQNRPTLRGQPVDALAYLEAFEGGFTAAYRWLIAQRADLLAANGPLARFAGVEARVLPRSGRRYEAILESSYHPDLLRDSAARPAFIEKRLRRDADDEAELARLIPHEQRALLTGDTPLFVTRPDSRDVVAADGQRLGDFYRRSGLDAARSRLAALDESDLARQQWFIRASFATVAPAAPANDRPPAPVAELSADLAGRALAAARAIGQWLARTAIHAGDEAGWIGLEPDEHGRWSIEPLGSDPAHGLPGVIHFLRALATLTGEGRWRELAGAAATTLRRYRREEADDAADEGLPAGATEPDDDAPLALAHHDVASIIAAIERHSPLTGAPLGVATPGWAAGLAGIGYGLLRVVAPELEAPSARPSVEVMA